MPALRLSMRRLREILRLKYDCGLSHRAIGRGCGVGAGTVSEYLQRARQAGLTWPLPEDLDDAALEARVFPVASKAVGPRPLPDAAFLHQELKRPGVTLQLLWVEYLKVLSLLKIPSGLFLLGFRVGLVDTPCLTSGR